MGRALAQAAVEGRALKNTRGRNSPQYLALNKIMVGDDARVLVRGAVEIGRWNTPEPAGGSSSEEWLVSASGMSRYCCSENTRRADAVSQKRTDLMIVRTARPATVVESRLFSQGAAVESIF